MQIDRYLTALQQSLATAAQTSPEEVQQAADRLAAAMEPALRLNLVEFAADLAAEITVQLEEHSVDVRFRGSGPEVVVTRTAGEPPSPEAPVPPPPPPPPAPPEDDGTARISLRLPESLKAQVEQAAAQDGTSTNSWLVRAAQGALYPGPHSGTPTTSGRRMTGWVR
ncbi:MAG TPA: histidine kinase [Beutenbergiaceae bacterium]|nr:histidine kinase [Beutenbergiaceae bacterium]